jgi:hypothetical protein
MIFAVLIPFADVAIVAGNLMIVLYMFTLGFALYYIFKKNYLKGAILIFGLAFGVL